MWSKTRDLSKPLRGTTPNIAMPLPISPKPMTTTTSPMRVGNRAIIMTEIELRRMRMG